MNRERFLRELQEALAGRLPEDEITEILADHAEFFDVGLAEGATEEEVVGRLGDPAKIALSLLRKEPLGSEPKTVQPSFPPKAPVHERIIALSVDVSISTLPFVWLSPRLAIVGFFLPQWVLHFIPSYLSTIRISNHWWIAAARPFWVAALFGSCLWFLLINPLVLLLLKGQTLGKRLFGLKVIDKSGNSASRTQLITRELFGKLGLNALLSTIWLPLSPIVSLASLVWSIVSPEGHTLWDSMANTRAVKTSAQRKRG